VYMIREGQSRFAGIAPEGVGLPLARSVSRQ
jgi:hypothetical protein